MGNRAESLPIARGKKTDVGLLPGMTNRHGLVAGATGTGKTVTLRVIAEQLSGIGVPVFLAVVKGDLSGIPHPGGDQPKVAGRAKTLGLTGFRYEGRPVVFWDLFGEQGHPVRATISDRTGYGNISAASIGTIQRNLLTMEQQGGDRFFGEPAIDLKDFLQTDASGKGMVNILVADKLMQSPRLYATFLLFLLSELIENLPEVGDPQKPTLVFFFDEAYLLFEDAPKALTGQIEQVVRLIRSKGVGVYFVTRNPLDLPETSWGSSATGSSTPSGRSPRRISAP